MKVFRNKKTGRLGETQYGNDADVLIRNAKANKFKNNEIEIIDMTQTAYNKAIGLQNIADKTPAQIREDKITKEIRDLAIKSLEDKGEL